jgi:hypothetical protein
MGGYFRSSSQTGAAKVGGVAETDCVSRTRDLGLRSGQGMQSTQVHPVQPCLSNLVTFLSLQYRPESKISKNVHR